MRILFPFRRSLLRASPLLVAACASGGHPPGPPIGGALLECGVPPHEGLAVSVVEAGGDVLAVRGHTFRLPPGAVRGRERFEVRDRQTRNVGVDIRPHGYRFADSAAAVITLSYARCGDGLPEGFRPTIVEVEPGDTTRVQELETTWDPESRTVTARIQHLSGYLISGT